MAYCLYTDIQSEFKDLPLTLAAAPSPSSITQEDVTEFIDQSSSMMDSYIINRYEVPVSGAPVSLKFLKMICIWLVKARVLSILSVKTPQDKTKQDPDGPSLYKQAIEFLKEIKKGNLVLTDATQVDGYDGGMSSYLMDECVEHDFKIGENAW
jgi:phage gp36-like protein